MNSNVKQLKKVALSLIGVALLALILLTPASAPVRAAGDDFDPSAVYKSKCMMCHGPKAEKKFDVAKPDAQLVDAILKGKDGTPKMPAYEKTINADQAKALVAYMKSLKS